MAALVIWGFDRLARLARILYFNFRWSNSTRSMERSQATFRALPGNMLEVSVNMARDWDFVPGQYCFIHLPSGHRCKLSAWRVCMDLTTRADLQSHPFTIMSYERVNDSNSSITPDLTKSDAKSSPNDYNEKSGRTEDNPDLCQGPDERRLKMLIRPKKGITGALRGLCQTGEERAVLVEGPYGNHSLPLACYDNVR